MPGPPAALLHPRLSALGSVTELSLPPPPPGSRPGSPPGGKVLPGPWPHADHGGEGKGGQEGEEAEVQQALEAVVADASEGVQVVLAEEEGHIVGGGVGHSLGSELVSESPSPPADSGSLPLPHPKHLEQPLRVHARDPDTMGLLGFSLQAFAEYLLCAGL